MVWGLVAALSAAVCYGVAAVMQALAARSAVDTDGGVDPRLLVRLLGQWRFVVGLGLDVVGFVLQILALRVLPLFLVQASLAASLAVTAVLATWLVGAVLGWREWVAVAVVCLGLTVLGVSAEGGESAVEVGLGFHWSLVAAAALLGLLGMAAGRLPDRARTPLLGLVAGLAFGLVAIASRVLSGVGATDLVSDPAAYAVPVAGVLAFLFYASALQRGGVTAATAMMVIGETVVPALVGTTMLGDETRPGFAPVAVAGFVVAVAGAVALARFGEVGAEPAEGKPE
ncbi:hypothetical protein [Actinokineospora sp. NBRC 105648]|uniref:hypothetical protein n=1 Tax=Actinokineospora sp. NBRC 105648 TaxID=3032206 RepID=UPI0024A38C69|nr:hypothetical protein [Actinokineospora sp. NBRC 105648]GLZ42217.1 membrane protein [Actinokineospora sp. NBRC 105648]